MQKRIVVFSDSHGNFQVLHDIILARPEAELFLFCGDGLREFEDLCCLFPEKDLRAVKGNCDWSFDHKVIDTAFCGGKKILFTHGHTSGVKRDLEPLVQTALDENYDILLFGHTHVPLSTYLRGVHVLNPGSVSQPRQGRPSYGVVDIGPAGIVTSIVPL